MLEGDELLELAQETGYRLCHSSAESEQQDSERQAVFSASWDVNNTFYRLFLCLQNGELKVIDFQEEVSLNTFQIRFRHHINTITDYQKIPDKLIHLHFDKFSTIAGKEHEILFLLGISKSIFHSKLPEVNTGAAFIPPGLEGEDAQPVRSGYHNGSPVLELASHPARITALSVSWQGKYLASGDENGNLKVILLQSKENMGQVINNEFQRINQQQLSRSGSNGSLLRAKEMSSTAKSNRTKKSLPRYDYCETIHKGPIFSLQWIFPSLTTAYNHSQGLLTGSMDRAVRMWSISYSVSHGFVIKPMMVFDTFSSHILSLQSFSSSMIAAQSQGGGGGNLLSSHSQQSLSQSTGNHLATTSNALTASNLLAGSLKESRDEDALSVTSSQAMFNKVAHYSYIFAGTNSGTLHIWKVYDKELLQSFTLINEQSQTEEEEDRGGEPSLAQQLLDNGKRLVALIQVSEYPVIHITTANMITSLSSLHNSFNGNLLLGVSDIHGQVRMYGTEYQTSSEAEIGTENVKEFFSSQSRDDFETHPLMALPENYVIDKIKTRFEKEFHHTYHEEPPKKSATTVSPSFTTNKTKKGGQERLMISTEEEEDEGGSEDHSLEEIFSPLKEEYFDSPVVACSFNSTARSAAMQKTELVIVTMNGMIRLYNDFNEPKLKVTQFPLQTLSSLLIKANSASNDIPNLEHPLISLRSNPRLSFIDSPEKLREKVRQDPNLLKDSPEDPLLVREREEGDGEGESLSLFSRTNTSLQTKSDRGLEANNNKDLQMLYEKKKRSLDKKQLQRESQSSPEKDNKERDRGGSGKRVSILQQSDEFDPKPRSQPPKPTPTTTSTHTSGSPLKRASVTATTITQSNMTNHTSHHQSQSETNTPSKRASFLRRGSMMSVKSFMSGTTSDDGESVALAPGEVRPKKYEEVNIPPSDYHNNNFQLAGLQSTKGLDSRIEKQYPFDVPASNNNNNHNATSNDDHQRELGSIHSDDITVSTVKTTKSDVIYARQQLAASRRHPRYSSLSEGLYLDSMEMSGLLPRGAKKTHPSNAMRKQMKSELLQEILNESEKELLEEMQQSQHPDGIFGRVQMHLSFHNNHNNYNNHHTGGLSSHWTNNSDKNNTDSLSSPGYSLEIPYFDHFPLPNKQLFKVWKDNLKTPIRATEDYLLSII